MYHRECLPTQENDGVVVPETPFFSQDRSGWQKDIGVDGNGGLEYTRPPSNH